MAGPTSRARPCGVSAICFRQLPGQMSLHPILNQVITDKCYWIHILLCGPPFLRTMGSRRPTLNSGCITEWQHLLISLDTMVDHRRSVWPFWWSIKCEGLSYSLNHQTHQYINITLIHPHTTHTWYLEPDYHITILYPRPSLTQIDFGMMKKSIGRIRRHWLWFVWIPL